MIRPQFSFQDLFVVITLTALFLLFCQKPIFPSPNYVPPLMTTLTVGYALISRPSLRWWTATLLGGIISLLTTTILGIVVVEAIRRIGY